MPKPIKKIVIMMAMAEEAKSIINTMDFTRHSYNELNDQLGLMTYRQMKGDTEVILVVSGHDRRFENICNVGPHFAGVTTWEVGTKLQPDLILNVGTCGAMAKNGVQIADVFISSGSFNYFDRRIPLGDYAAYGKGGFPCLPINRMAVANGLKPGNISTGNSLDINETDESVLKSLNTDVKEMEAAGIAEFARLLKIPVVAIKSVTNLTGTELQTTEITGSFEDNLQKAMLAIAEKLPQVVNFIVDKKPWELDIDPSTLQLATLKQQLQNTPFGQFYSQVRHDATEIKAREEVDASKINAILDLLYDQYHAYTYGGSHANAKKSLAEILIQQVYAQYPQFAFDKLGPELGITSIEELSDGNINFVFRVRNNKGDSIIIKYAADYLRKYPDIPLATDRIYFEATALTEFRECCTEHVPKVFHYNKSHCFIIMEDLNHHYVIRQALVEGKKFPQLAEHMANFFAETLFRSSSFHLNYAKKMALTQKFCTNIGTCGITQVFFFSLPFMDDPSNIVAEKNTQQAQLRSFVKTHVWENQPLLAQVQDLKYRFENEHDALLHGDVHTGSIMANENETYVIDAEFAFMGPIGFDIGSFIANMLLASISAHHRKPPNPHHSNWLLAQIEILLQRFTVKFMALWQLSPNCNKTNELFKIKYIQNILSSAVGFAGVEMLRRTIGCAQVYDLESISDSESQLAAQKRAVEMSIALVQGHKNIHTLEDIVSLLGNHHHAVTSTSRYLAISDTSYVHATAGLLFLGNAKPSGITQEQTSQTSSSTDFGTSRICN